MKCVRRWLSQDDVALDRRSGWIRVTAAGSSLMQCKDMSSVYMGVSKNRGTPKSSILIGFPIINRPFWGTPIFRKHPYTHIWIISMGCRHDGGIHAQLAM